MAQQKMMASEAERDSIEKAFPLLQKIADERIRQGVTDVWATLWRESGYRSLDEAPNQDGCDEDTLVRHTNAVTSAALAVAEQLAEEYGIQVNRDILLAASILHDVDKLVLYEKRDGCVQLSAMGKVIPHGSYGGHAALDAGLPLDIANTIITHSRDCGWQPATIEGIIINYCDLAKFFAVRMALGKQPAKGQSL